MFEVVPAARVGEVGVPGADRDEDRPVFLLDDERAYGGSITLAAGFDAGARARIVAEDGSVLPDDGGWVGELEVRGPWVARSYYSPQGGIVEPGEFRDGWLRTGDIGRISPDGFLALVDRQLPAHWAFLAEVPKTGVGKSSTRSARAACMPRGHCRSGPCADRPRGSSTVPARRIRWRRAARRRGAPVCR
ncbi:hypothetical protein GCM10027445_25330 [Amycolatopsis endophytica]|uniref:AMP-dependent synthetase/ligase domain-containing protein n=1 Tax=Amycolatopsis endophytica TaxID=860233 RepID=A0A853BC67_9PSEU|nr:hypothetical protein [Amycolatopsis endophytica]